MDRGRNGAVESLMTSTSFAVAFVALASLALVVWVVWLFRRSPYTPVQTVLFYIDVLLVRLLWRADMPHKLPPGCERGAIIVANHRSSIDPFFIQIVAGRPVHWMVAAEYFAMPLAGWFLRQTEAIPTRRGGVDTASTKAAIRFAQQGEFVGMFPEGRINTTSEFLLPVRPGAAIVAIRSGAPMVPCYIEGSPYDGTAHGPLFMRARVRMRFGAPIDVTPYAHRVNDREAAKELTVRVMKEIARLANRDDYEPRLAGKQWMPDAEGQAQEVEA